MGYVHLLIAIIMEVLGTTCMKLAEGFTKLVPSILVFVLYGISLLFLTLALKRIDVSVSYAIWSGVGTAMIAAIGFVFFSETVTPLKIGSIALIILGVVGLNMGGGVH